MNYFEVIKEENIGKSYEIVIDGMSKGVWELKETSRRNEFDFYKDRLLLTETYFSSQLMRMEFREVTDWSKVPVDTKVLVSDDGEEWNRRHFAKYEDGKVYCFNDGYTSFTIVNYAYLSNATSWEYAKLYQE